MLKSGIRTGTGITKGVSIIRSMATNEGYRDKLIFGIANKMNIVEGGFVDLMTHGNEFNEIADFINKLEKYG